MVPGVFNPLVGKLAERMGFEAVYLSGGALSAGTGIPDVGLLTLTEFVASARDLVLATTLPVISDADTGFGGAFRPAQPASDSRPHRPINAPQRNGFVFCCTAVEVTVRPTPN